MKARLIWAAGLVALSAACGTVPSASMMENDEDIEANLEGEPLPSGDLNWLLFVASYDASEVKLARLARASSTEPLVQEFGAVKELRHQKSITQAEALAVQANTLLASQVTAIGERHYVRLDHIGSSLFDREFLALQVQLHQEAARAAAQAAADAPAGEVREWAARARDRWRRDEVWAGRLYQQVLTTHRGRHRSARLFADPSQF